MGSVIAPGTRSGPRRARFSCAKTWDRSPVSQRERRPSLMKTPQALETTVRALLLHAVVAAAAAGVGALRCPRAALVVVQLLDISDAVHTGSDPLPAQLPLVSK